MFNKRSLLEYFLIPLLVSFFMSGINATLELKTEKNIEFEILFYEWISNWFIAYPCLLILVPFSKKIVLSLTRRMK